jgi:hypothetical protein
VVVADATLDRVVALSLGRDARRLLDLAGVPARHLAPLAGEHLPAEVGVLDHEVRDNEAAIAAGIPEGIAARDRREGLRGHQRGGVLVGDHRAAQGRERVRGEDLLLGAVLAPGARAVGVVQHPGPGDGGLHAQPALGRRTDASGGACEVAAVHAHAPTVRGAGRGRLDGGGGELRRAGARARRRGLRSRALRCTCTGSRRRGALAAQGVRVGPRSRSPRAGRRSGTPSR